LHLPNDISAQIHDLNREIKRCKKCRLYLTRKNAVPGEGNVNARIMLIAQAPGEKEDKASKMFIGPTGEVLNEFLKLSGIDRVQIYMTNLIKCMLPKYRKPKTDEITICSAYLDREIEIIRPEFLVPLGFHATRYILTKYGVNINNEDIPKNYGKLLWTGNKKVYPLQHPSSVLYNPSEKDKILSNYKKLRVFLQECKWYPVCPMKWYYEGRKIDRKWVELYCKGDWESCIRYQKEENGEYHPDWMLPDGTIDEKLKE